MLYIIVVLIILLDQATKFAAIKYLKGESPYIIIKIFSTMLCGKLRAAFGILQNKKIFFVIITSIVIISIIFFLQNSNPLTSY